VTASAFVVVLLAACGQSSTTAPPTPTPGPVAKSEFLPKVEANCAMAQKAQAALGAPPRLIPGKITAQDMPAVAVYLDKVIPTFQDLRKRGKALGEPDEDADLYDKAGAQLDIAIAAQMEADAAAHKSDPVGFIEAFGRFQAGLQKSSDLIKSFGSKVCPAPVAAPGASPSSGARP